MCLGPVTIIVCMMTLLSPSPVTRTRIMFIDLLYTLCVDEGLHPSRILLVIFKLQRHVSYIINGARIQWLIMN